MPRLQEIISPCMLAALVMVVDAADKLPCKSTDHDTMDEAFLCDGSRSEYVSPELLVVKFVRLWRVEKRKDFQRIPQ